MRTRSVYPRRLYICLVVGALIVYENRYRRASVFPAACIGSTSGRAWRGGKRGGSGEGAQSCPLHVLLCHPVSPAIKSYRVVCHLFLPSNLSLFLMRRSIPRDNANLKSIHPSSKKEKKESSGARWAELRRPAERWRWQPCFESRTRTAVLSDS